MKSSKLARWLKCQGSQRVIAEKLGTNQVSVCLWIAGRHLPAYHQMLKIERMSNFEVNCSDMIREFVNGKR